MGCCGGKAPKGARRPLHGGVPRAPVKAIAQPARGDEMLLIYNGPRKGDFQVVAGVTRTRYRVPGKGGIVEFAQTGRQGVNPADVAWFKSVNSGRDFKPVERPKAAAAPAPAPARKVKVTQVTRVEPVTWVAETMEPDEAPEPVIDIQSLTVAEIRELELAPFMALALRGQELAGKNRKSVIAHLEGLG